MKKKISLPRNRFLPKTPSLIDKWFPRAQSDSQAVQIAIHETLHIAVNEDLCVPNTVFTEALFDFLCGRGFTGLWFAEEAFHNIERTLT